MMTTPTKSKIFKAPEKTPEVATGRSSLFLAGSIEMGKAVDWQTKVQAALRDAPIDIYNPRRDDWDSSWKQDILDPQFNQQVTWELDHLESSDYVFMYFDPETKAPISLLELGLFAKAGKMIVVCPKGFYRKGNVDIVCNRFKVPVLETLEAGIKLLQYVVKRG